MSDFGWTDVLTDEDPVGNPTVHLPKDNEGKPEREEQGQPAAGDLPEDDTDPGMHDVPFGTDPNNGMKSGDYETLYGATVAELQQMKAERDALKAALEIAYDYAMSWIGTQRCAYVGYKPELFAQWEKDEAQMRAALAEKGA